MASLPATATAPQTPSSSLKLLVKGFAGFDMRLLVGVVKLSRHRTPALEMVSDPAAAVVDVVMIDGKDEAAMAWAEQHKTWLDRQPVVWVDCNSPLPTGHINVNRPVQWTHLPVLLSRVMDDAAAGKGDSGSEPPAPQHAQTPAAPLQKPLANSSIPAHAQSVPLLVVDDSAAVRGHLSSVLQKWGYEITAVDSGEAGVLAIDKKEFACVLMDVLMPGIDGYDACRRIKAMPHRADTPVVMLTSKSSPFDKIRGKMAGCNAYLTKPVEKARLMEVLSLQVRKSN